MHPDRLLYEDRLLQGAAHIPLQPVQHHPQRYNDQWQSQQQLPEPGSIPFLWEVPFGYPTSKLASYVGCILSMFHR